MENNIENNRITDNISDSEEYRFRYNFINEPWDDRSYKSKIGIITTLCATFIAIMALVTNNLVLHYRGFDHLKFHSTIEIDCNAVKVENYLYVARIHSVASNEIICVGAVISQTSVIANELCLKSGPIRLRLGSSITPSCKKGFNVNAVDFIYHEGGITKSLVILSTFENIKECIEIIKIGMKLDLKRDFLIIGRPYRRGKILSLQFANYDPDNTTLLEKLSYFNLNKTICVQIVGKCPVRAGDMLIQKGQLLGLASMSINRREKSKTVCFANLSIVHNEIQKIDSTVEFITSG